MQIPDHDPRLEERRVELEKSLGLFANWRLEFAARPTIYVLNKSTIQRYLGAGGTLPGVENDPDQEDKITTSFFSGATESGVKPNESVTLPVDESWDTSGRKMVLSIHAMVSGAITDPDDPDQAFAIEAYRTMLAMRDKFGYLSLYGCVVNLMGKEQNKALAVHARWLHAAMIDYYCFRTLRESGDDAFADTVEALWGVKAVADAQHPDPSLSLRYWTAALGAMDSKGEVLGAFNDRRRARAQVELQRLIAAVGRDKLIKVLEQITDQGIESTAGFEAAFAKQTGYNVGDRLDLYQPAADAQSVYNHEINLYMQAREAGDLAQTLLHAFVALEAQHATGGKINPKLYDILNLAVQPFGDAALWCGLHEVFFKLARADKLDTQTPEAWPYMVHAALHALHAGKPDLAYELTQHHAEVDWPTALDPEARLARVAVEIVEAERLIGKGELEDARAMLAAAAEYVEQSDGPNRFKTLFEKSLQSAREHLEAERAKSQAAPARPGV